jgi:hypothetical protein
MTTHLIANKNARKFVEARQPFKGSNLYAERRTASHGHTDIYVVYSYGPHFPIYVAEVGDNGEVHWYENEGKYSQSTTRHQSQARPSYVKLMPMTTAMLQALVRDGIAGVAAGSRG